MDCKDVSFNPASVVGAKIDVEEIKPLNMLGSLRLLKAVEMLIKDPDGIAFMDLIKVESFVIFCFLY
jgi:hypothetical protein